MNKGIYLATLEPNSGKSIFALGLMQELLGTIPRVAYYRPVIDDYPEGVQDHHIATIISHFNLPQSYEESFTFSRSEIIEESNAGQGNMILERIIKDYKKLESEYDFVLVEGTDFTGEGNVFEFDLNMLIVRNFGLPVIVVSSGVGKSIEEFRGSLDMAYKTFRSKDIQTLAVVANKIQPENLEWVQQEMEKFLPKKVQAYTIPLIPELAQPTVKEVLDTLQGEILIGQEDLYAPAGKFVVGAMQLRNFLQHLTERSMVITPGDRADLILGAIQANQSDNYPHVSAIILTGGIPPESSVMKLLEGMEHIIPLVLVQEGTFEITDRISRIKSNVYPENTSKIQASLQTFTHHIDLDPLLHKLAHYKSSIITPHMFQYKLLQRAKVQRKRIVLPESNDARILEATARLVAQDVVDIILIGKKNEIQQKLNERGILLDLNSVTITHPTTSPDFEDYAETLYQLRKHKNVNRDMARDLMNDVSYFGTMMIYKGHADGMVSGAAHTTQHTIRPALQFIKTKPGVNVVSSVFFMCLPDRVSVFGDCAIVPNPTAEELAEIAISSAQSSQNFGIEPRVAMLSYSSGSSGKGAEVEKVRTATEIVRQEQPQLLIEGPIQYDAAVDKHVGHSKMPNSRVAGQASVLIFPDLNTGNNTYKAVQRETGALAIGPMLQGLNKPVNDLSRGCTVDDIFNTVILTAVQAQEHSMQPEHSDAAQNNLH
ncbi:MAG: phosphate acetyltransferase [Weeksellaceae bacterium]|nr:phosphate acetyltransferase [Weeksellaceae bacterium]